MRLGQGVRGERERHAVIGGARAGGECLGRAAQPAQVAARPRGDRVDRLVVGHEQQLVLGAQGREQVLDHAPCFGHQRAARRPRGPHAAALVHERDDTGRRTTVRPHAAAQRRA